MAEDPREAEEALGRHGEELASVAEEVLGDWVRRCVHARAGQAGVELSQESLAATEQAAELAAGEVGAELRNLLAIDIDQQRRSPLEVLRTAVRYPTAVLRHAGVPPVERDEFSVRGFPEDDYDLSPASFADVAPELHEPGIVWGAAKAHLHMARHRDPLR
ncbi:MAG: hypothetical protein M9942_05155 [Microthrixaceae bacterium]|nr:hypothetical protein [Microthrixaceae bacterium]